MRRISIAFQGNRPLWAGEFIGEPVNLSVEKSARLPKMTNTDQEPLRFSKLFFKVLQHEGLEEKRSNTAKFEYDSDAKTGIWSKKGNRKIKMVPTTTLGSLKIQGDYLIAVTNSLERALKLKNKLQRHFAKHLSYESARLSRKLVAFVLAAAHFFPHHKSSLKKF